MTNRRPTRAARLGVTAMAALLVACGGGGGSDGDGEGGRDVGRTAVLTEMVDEVIIPSYEATVVGFDALGASIDELCAAPSDATLEAARAAWRDVDQAWRSTRATGVGPAMERRLAGAIGFLARPDAVAALLAGTDPVDPATLADVGAAVKGLSALEIALFADGSEGLAADGDPRRCEYAGSVAELGGQASAVVLEDWTGPSDGRATFLEGMDGDEQSSIDAVVNEVIFRVIEVDDQGLRALVEAASVDELPANRADGPAAFHLAELQATFDGVAAALGDEDDDRISALVRAGSSDTADRLDAARDAALDALRALPASVTEALADKPALAAAQEAVNALRVLLSTEVASELGVTMGFSDADGDS